MMPDGGISPIRFEVLGFSPVDLSLFAKAQAPVRIHPGAVACPRPGLLDSARRLPRFIKPATHADVGNRQVPRVPYS